MAKPQLFLFFLEYSTARVRVYEMDGLDSIFGFRLKIFGSVRVTAYIDFFKNASVRAPVKVVILAGGFRNHNFRFFLLP